SRSLASCTPSVPNSARAVVAPSIGSSASGSLLAKRLRNQESTLLRSPRSHQRHVECSGSRALITTSERTSGSREMQAVVIGRLRQVRTLAPNQLNSDPVQIGLVTPPGLLGDF